MEGRQNPRVILLRGMNMKERDLSTLSGILRWPQFTQRVVLRLWVGLKHPSYYYSRLPYMLWYPMSVNSTTCLTILMMKLPWVAIFCCVFFLKSNCHLSHMILATTMLQITPISSDIYDFLSFSGFWCFQLFFEFFKSKVMFANIFR